MTAGTRVDLHGAHPRRTDPLGVIRRLLVPFDDRDSELALEIAQCALEQRGLSSTGAAEEIERQHAAAGEPVSIALGDQLVLTENLRFELHRPAIPARDGQVLPVVRMLRTLQIDLRRDLIVRVHVLMARRVDVIVHMTMIVTLRVPRRKNEPARVRMPRPIRMNMLARLNRQRGLALPPTTACHAHSSTSISLINNSCPGLSTISSSAPSSGVPWAQISKQNRMESGTTADSRPISSRTRVTRCPTARSDTMATTLRVIESSCTPSPPQQIRGSCSPESISTIRSPPNEVDRITLPAGADVTSPTIADSRPAGCARITANKTSAAARGTIAASLPSFARYKGSSPRISQAPRTTSLMGNAASRTRMQTSEAVANSLSTVARPPRVASRKQRMSGQTASMAATSPCNG